MPISEDQRAQVEVSLHCVWDTEMQGKEMSVGAAEMVLAFHAHTCPILSGQLPSCSFPPLSKFALGKKFPDQEILSWYVIQVWFSRFLHIRLAQFLESTGGKILKISCEFANIFKI